MPLTDKGKEIMRSMKKEYGPKRGERVFYASKNKGTNDTPFEERRMAATI